MKRESPKDGNRSANSVLGLGVVFVFLMVVLSCGIGYVRLVHAQSTSGFVTREARFDESVGGSKPTPTIPSGWRFVGVSNGEKMNSNTLWFQDRVGNIYIIQGFTTHGQFILDETIYKIAAEK
jgi:hypothetical protein